MKRLIVSAAGLAFVIAAGCHEAGICDCDNGHVVNHGPSYVAPAAPGLPGVPAGEAIRAMPKPEGSEPAKNPMTDTAPKK